MSDQSPMSKSSNSARRFGIVASIFAAVLIVAAAGILAYGSRQDPGRPGAALSSMIGGPFHLVDQNGKPFTEANLKGKWHLVFFGYTHCPDVCPTTLNELSLAVDHIVKKTRAEIGIVFVSVDPERDTPDVLKSYVSSFDAPITALSGTDAEVKQIASDYRVYYAKHPREDGGYDMDHSAIIYVMDPEGRFTATLTPDEAAPDIEARLQKLIS
jgi:protein SCO1/2